MRETLKQEVALSFCLHNEEKFYFYYLFLVTKNVQKNLTYREFFSESEEKINLISTFPTATRARWGKKINILFVREGFVR